MQTGGCVSSTCATAGTLPRSSGGAATPATVASNVTTCLISLICKLGQNIQYYEQSWHEVGLKSPSLAAMTLLTCYHPPPGSGCRCRRAGTGAAGRATATRTGGTSSSGSACTRGGHRHVTRVTIV